MAQDSPQRWNVYTWFRDWVNTRLPGPWNSPPGSWRRWFAYDHTVWLVFLGFWFHRALPGPRLAG